MIVIFPVPLQAANEFDNILSYHSNAIQMLLYTQGQLRIGFQFSTVVASLQWYFDFRNDVLQELEAVIYDKL